jgi:hypothetical protein
MMRRRRCLFVDCRVSPRIKSGGGNDEERAERR